METRHLRRCGLLAPNLWSQVSRLAEARPSRSSASARLQGSLRRGHLSATGRHVPSTLPFSSPTKCEPARGEDGSGARPPATLDLQL